ncbi:response regulator transcription factor [Ferruginivarius sediminum]|uniref:response regulator transcription factor n=1 Tax=Ferruginivarius sediminum TaxID=2661937 RepID=UPI001F4DB34E|nr:response regulator transcription factor [Ferruginivarius sediminum]
MSNAEASRLMVVDDDALFRESLIENLRDDGYEVVDFAAGQPAVDYLCGGGSADLVVLDWRMPGISGIQVLRAIREHGIDVPVIFLTVLGDQIYEEAALNHGAVDFVEKSRSLAILKRRIELSVRRNGHDQAAAAGETAAEPAEGLVRVGRLEIDRETSRAYWRGEEVPLTLNEFRIVDLLATRAGRDVRYRELYDQVHGAGFIAGSGEEGFRGNVRTLIKRIRQKFRVLDSQFEAIENYPGFGYRWRDDSTAA